MRDYFSVFSSFRAWLYEALQTLIGANKGRSLLAQQFSISSYTSVLDLGCGTGMLPGYLSAKATYLGVDLCPNRIALARKRWPCHDFLVADVTDLESHVDQPFQLVLAVGLLHHLDDFKVERMLKSISAILAPDGKVLLVDPVLYSGQSLFSRLLCSLDAGNWVRSIEGYRQAIPDSFLVLSQDVRNDLLRIPQSLQVMELALHRGAVLDV